MIDLSNIASSDTLVVLRGEYGIVQGENKLIASPNAKNGTVLVLCDAENKITAMAHFDGEQKLENNLDKILREMLMAGANTQNFKCNIIGKTTAQALESLLHERQITHIATQTRSDGETHNIITPADHDTIYTIDDPDIMRHLMTKVMFSAGGDERVSNAMNSAEFDSLVRIEDKKVNSLKPSTHPHATSPSRLLQVNQTNARI